MSNNLAYETPQPDRPPIYLAADNTGIELLDKKPPGVVLSASQIDTWSRCRRRWAYEYILKIRTPSHPSAILGGKVHSLLEAWLRDGTPPQQKSSSTVDIKAAAIAVRMIACLVANGIQIGQGDVERRFWFRTRHGHVYTGFIDWTGMLADAIGGLYTVTDHKTSGNMRYAKTEADLHSDIQAVLYSVVAFAGFGVDTLRLYWNYGETKGKFNTKAVKTIVHLPVVMEKFERVIEPAAAEMIVHREAGTDPYAFPVSPQSCGDFGGCPHTHRCALTPEQLFRGTMSTQPTMQEKMAQQQQPNGQYQQGTLPGQQPPPQQQQQQPLPGQQPPPQQQQQPQQPLPGQQPPPQQQQQQPPQQQPLPGQQPPQQQQQIQPGMPGVQQQPPQQPVSAPPVQQLPGQGQGLPGQGQPPGQGPGVLVGDQAPPQQAQQPYAPDVAPNPPEAGQAPPPAAPEEIVATTTSKGKGRAKVTLTIEQQVYMGGVYAKMTGSDVLDGNHTPETAAAAAQVYGQIALAAFNKQFG